MSEHIARAAVERMHLREMAVAQHYTGLAADFCQMALSDPAKEQDKFLARRADLCSAFGLPSREQVKPFAFSDGVAVIPVSGTLINRFGASWGWVTGYNFIRQQMNLALADDDVKAIVFDLNSFGGEAAGCFELSNDIAAARGVKPMVGVIDSNCYSACYAIGSALDKLYVTPSGGAGSIGVLTMHVDMSGALEKMGLNITLIQAGKHKTDGNPFNALPESVQSDIQAGVDALYGTFVSTVAHNRGIDADAVKKTEARIYRAEEAVELGLVDAIAHPTEAVRALFGELSGSNTQEEPTMTVTTQQPGGVNESAAQASTVDTAALSAEARTAERERISAILNCEEAAGRDKLASHLALTTDMNVDAAKGILAAAPVETAEKPAAAANPFAAAMDADRHPQVGADTAGVAGGDDPGQSPHLQILRNQEMATGEKFN